MKKKRPVTPLKRQVRRGRPTLFEGERIRMSLKLTVDAKKMVDDAREKLVLQGHGHAATEGAAVEFLIRKATLRQGAVMTALPPTEIHTVDAPRWESLARPVMA